VRIHLDTGAVAAGAPATVIRKFSSAHLPIRGIARTLGLYGREVGFYRDVAGLDGQGAGMPTPGCFYAAYEADPVAHMLLLEDMDGEIGDHAAGSTPDQAEQIVRWLAAFHARWWEAPELDQFDWLTVDAAQVSQRLQVSFDQALDSALRVCEPHVGAHFAATLRRLQPRVASIAMAQAQSPRTLCHGDAHTANVFYPTSGDLSPEQRRAAAPRLAKAYVSELEARGIADYPIIAYERDFPVCTLYHAVTMTIALGAVDVSTDRGQELVSSIVPRVAAMVEDLGDISDVLDGLD